MNIGMKKFGKMLCVVLTAAMLLSLCSCFDVNELKDKRVFLSADRTTAVYRDEEYVPVEDITDTGCYLSGGKSCTVSNDDVPLLLAGDYVIGSALYVPGYLQIMLYTDNGDSEAYLYAKEETVAAAERALETCGEYIALGCRYDTSYCMDYFECDDSYAEIPSLVILPKQTGEKLLNLQGTAVEWDETLWDKITESGYVQVYLTDSEGLFSEEFHLNGNCAGLTCVDGEYYLFETERGGMLLRPDAPELASYYEEAAEYGLRMLPEETWEYEAAEQADCGTEEYEDVQAQPADLT